MSIDFKVSDQEKEIFQQVLDALNPKQKEAVDQIEGPVMVIAGPGTGKTQLLAAKIGNILQSEDNQAEAHNILCLTYTDAGTIAMRKRLLEFIGPLAYNVSIYTFHGFCNEVIQDNLEYFGKKELDPISDLENIELLEKLIESLPPSNVLKRLKADPYFEVSRMNSLYAVMKKENWSIDYIIKSVNDYLEDLPNREEFIYKKGNSKTGVKTGDVKQKDIDKKTDQLIPLKEAALLFSKYQEMMLVANRYDYADMIQWVVKAFKENENILRDYQERYQYILVDEFQDTSGAQSEILNSLIGYWEVPNVFVVGDDDQCVYEFQGARVNNILDFQKRYSGNNSLKLITLSDNYRSTQEILNTAGVLIQNNKERLVNHLEGVEKNLIACSNEVKQSTVKPKIIEYPNPIQESAATIIEIEKLQKEGVDLKDIAILYYKHKQIADIVQLLEKKDIPYQVKKKINILDIKLIQNILTLLKYIEKEYKKPGSGEYLLHEILHYYFFNINSADIANISVYCAVKKDRAWRNTLINPSILEKAGVTDPFPLIAIGNKLSSWISDIANLTLQAVFEKVINDSGLLKYIQSQPDKHFLLQAISTLFNYVQEESSRNKRLKLDALLELVERMESYSLALDINKSVFNENGVNLITVHSAKGLEFKYVYLIGCTKDMWEGSRGGYGRYTLPDTITSSSDNNKTETDRRLFYVAITRAKEFLHISYAKNNDNGKVLEQSRFVQECLENNNLKTEQASVKEEQLFDLQYKLLETHEISKDHIPNKSFIDDILKNFSLSPTKMNLYLECPVSFYYENVLRVPGAKNKFMGYGNAVHHALNILFEEMKNNNNTFPDLKFLMNEFEKSMYYNHDSFTEKEFKLTMQLGQEQLPAYYNHYVNKWEKVTVTEYRITNAELDGTPINGILDKIEFDNNTVNVIDYKTSNPDKNKKSTAPPSEKEPLGGNYWRQVIFYKILLDQQKLKSWNMISGEIDFIEPSKTDKEFKKAKIMITDDAINLVKGLIKDSYAKIKNQEFFELCERPNCKWCDFVRENGQF